MCTPHTPPTPIPEFDYLHVLLKHVLAERPNADGVACLEIARGPRTPWADPPPELIARLRDGGVGAVPGSECAQTALAEAQEGTGWRHTSTQRPAERYRIRVHHVSADSARLFVDASRAIDSTGCSYRVRSVESGWEVDLLDPPCAAGTRSR